MSTSAMVASRINSDPELRRRGFHAYDFDLWLHRPSADWDNRWHCDIYHVWSHRTFQGVGDTFSAAITDAMNKLKAALPKEPK